MPEPTLLSICLLLISVAWASGGVSAGVWLAMRPTGRRVGLRILLWVGLWLALTFFVGASGVVDNFDSMPPRPVFVLLPILVLTMVLARSEIGGHLAKNIPIAALLIFQAFRVPVELMLWSLSEDGVIGQQLTFEGYNFDIASGLFGLLLGLVACKRQLPAWMLWIYNIVGLILLATIVAMAMLSMPTPMRMFAGPPMTVITRAPFIWLPTVLVCAALFGHLVLMRALLSQKSPRR